jgi:catalase
MGSGNGAPVDDPNNSKTVGEYGPILLEDFHLVDKLAHFDRERIPERVVHAKGAGAYGYFEVSHDISRYCKAKLFNRVGKRTPVLVRFSTVGGEKGSADSARDPRGFAIKHYTEEGIWDMTGNNTPVFFIRDPELFPPFIHTQKRHPQTNLPDADMFWDFLTLVPESIHQVTVLMSDRGTPATYRHMNGYSSHTFRLVNDSNEAFYVKFHYKTDAGIRNLSGPDSAEMRKNDPDHATRDLFEHIASGKEATWSMYIQVMPVAEAENYKWNVFDVTKVWPHSDYPLVPVGKLVLNRNPRNYFAEIEQAAFSPGHLVPGIEVSQDRMLQARVFSYPDTHRHRLGANYMQLPVNCPYVSGVHNYQRDGPMTLANPGPGPNYYPNSVDGTPRPQASAAQYAFSVKSGRAARYPHKHPNDDFEQAGVLFSRVMTETDREHLIDNIVGHAKAAKPSIQRRVVEYFSRAHPDYGRRVAEGLRSASL